MPLALAVTAALVAFPLVWGDCPSCLQTNQPWCVSSQACVTSNDSSSCPCLVKPPASSASLCPTTGSCSSYTNCSECFAQRCAWCTATGTCVLPGEDLCSEPACPNREHCLEIPFPGSTCDVCPSHTDCASCHSAFCSWCATTSKCFKPVGDTTQLCEQTASCDGPEGCLSTNQQSCWDCSTRTTCSDCNSAPSQSCAWCPGSNTCLPAVKGKACSSLACPTATYSERWMCPLGDCGNLTTCKECTDANCVFCSDPQRCETQFSATEIVFCNKSNLFNRTCTHKPPGDHYNPIKDPIVIAAIFACSITFIGVLCCVAYCCSRRGRAHSGSHGFGWWKSLPRLGTTSGDVALTERA